MKKNILLTIMLVTSIINNRFIISSDNTSSTNQVVQDIQNQRLDKQTTNNESITTKIANFIENNIDKETISAISTISAITLGLAVRSAFDENPKKSFVLRNVLFYAGAISSGLGVAALHSAIYDESNHSNRFRYGDVSEKMLADVKYTTLLTLGTVATPIGLGYMALGAIPNYP
ncbi:MAG: hypothetical protein CL947_03055 [Epsilonproteobacteria bacterium]|nr:hypothetical protein [Campylobacterota bacterium]|tara:strand:+ start:667 stop:1188 length:522 start_codon:yes stop_codon:yes gene_type:complete